MLLDGKTIIITGASSGIGAAAAELFAEHGANVVLGARREENLQGICEAIRQKGGSATYVAGDVSYEPFARALVDKAQLEFGGLYGAFNNAGTVGDLGPLTDMSQENWDFVLRTNLTSAFHAARHQIPAMVKSGGGSVLFTSTFVGHTVGLPGMAAYAASKAALVGLTQVLAVEHGTDNIRVNALLPGGTRTDMAGDDPKAHEWVAGLHALKRMAEPVEIAQAALFLMSDQASFVTGSAMVADGGNSIYKA